MKGVFANARYFKILRISHQDVFSAGRAQSAALSRCYGEHVGVIYIKTLEMIEGDLPLKALALVKEWAEQHRDELMRIWDTQEFVEIPPLK